MTKDDAVPVTAELLPCPFCGGEASADGHIRYSKPLADTWWEGGLPITEAFYVNCIKCGAVARSGLVGGYQTKAEAIERWNARHRGSTAGVDDFAARKAVNGVLAGLLAPLMSDLPKMIEVGNQACTEILAALASLSQTPATPMVQEGLREALDEAFDFLGGCDGASEIRSKILRALSATPAQEGEGRD